MTTGTITGRANAGNRHVGTPLSDLTRRRRRGNRVTATRSRPLPPAVVTTTCEDVTRWLRGARGASV